MNRRLCTLISVTLISFITLSIWGTWAKHTLYGFSQAELREYAPATVMMIILGTLFLMCFNVILGMWIGYWAWICFWKKRS